MTAARSLTVAYSRNVLFLYRLYMFRNSFFAFMFSEGIDEIITRLTEALALTNTPFVPPFQIMIGET
jgi:hypothetical protein